MNFDPKKDYYGILNVTSSAELAVIKAAYKALALIYHPDRNPSKDAELKMIVVNEAWDVLSDPATRKEYDEAIVCVATENDKSEDANKDSADANAYSGSGINEILDIEIKRLNAERQALLKELAKARATSPSYLPSAWKAVVFLWVPLIALAIYGELYTWEDYPILGDIFVGYLVVAILSGAIVLIIENWYQDEIRRVDREINKIEKKIQQLSKSKTA